MSELFTIKKILDIAKDTKNDIYNISERFFNKIKNEDKNYNSFINLNENFLAESKNASLLYKESKNRKLEGIPLSIKDNIMIKDQKCTCGSKILSNFVSPYDATVIERLKENGANFIGKTNMDEFAMGSTNETSYFGPVKNPLNQEFIPGGSSGGSAASVAAGFVPASLGTDTGGSVRQPASFCGIVGFKPTYGLVSRYGVVAYGSSLDQVGTLTHTCEDASILLKFMKGLDKRDPTSSNINPKNIDDFGMVDIKGKKIAVIGEILNERCDERIVTILKDRLKKLEKKGAIIDFVSMPIIDYSVSIYYIIASAEASSNLGRYDGIRYGLRSGKKDVDAKTIFTHTRSEGFGDEIKRRIVMGNFVLSSGYTDAYYKKAQKARIVLSNKFYEMFEKYDFIITPTSPVLPFKLGETIDNPLTLYNADLCTIPANLSGLPALSIPVGQVGGLSVGMQIIANRFNDGELLGVGEFIQKEVVC